jgi:hypothetical protein
MRLGALSPSAAQAGRQGVVRSWRTRPKSLRGSYRQRAAGEGAPNGLGGGPHRAGRGAADSPRCATRGPFLFPACNLLCSGGLLLLLGGRIGLDLFLRRLLVDRLRGLVAHKHFAFRFWFTLRRRFLCRANCTLRGMHRDGNREVPHRFFRAVSRRPEWRFASRRGLRCRAVRRARAGAPATTGWPRWEDAQVRADPQPHTWRSSDRNWTASPTCALEIRSAPSRSAMVRETLRIRS